MNVETMINNTQQLPFKFNTKVRLSFDEIGTIHPIDLQVYNSDITKMLNLGLISGSDFLKSFTEIDYAVPLDQSKLHLLPCTRRVLSMFENMVIDEGYNTTHPVEDYKYFTCYLKTIRKGFVVECTMSLSKSEN